ncbi:L-aspartate oxidase [Timonella sp. A28]|uniref:L-aspartate oxidase n=1 Tax=Timonella sp. A28 TaxID=3442640 RepID=UPI003EB938CE
MHPVTGSSLTLPTRLSAPAPGWVTHADVIVVGSGIAGLTAALELRSRVGRVLLVTKDVLSSGATVWAQGGIAAALDPSDSPQAHLEDTLVAGVGLCDPEAVEVLVTEGPARVRELIARGTQFDREADGEVALTREGGHHADRIAHAGGDATGAEISRALVAQLEAVRNDPGIEIIEHAQVVDILTTSGLVEPQDNDEDRRVACGVTLHVRGEGTRDGVGSALARAVVLATGGIGQLYVSSTNPSQATGDGAAAALRAGADLADLEFVQFHPTVLWLGSGARGQLTLISEAVRGEGAYLIDVEGHRFMPGLHPMAELAPRDVVAHAIVAQMEKTGSDHVLLDARHLGADFLKSRFPTICEKLREQGFDLTAEPVPVAPAQHYHSGGIVTNTQGRSTLRGLYAVGEAACTGVHGANRLASNSLLEGLVFAKRAAQDIADRIAAGELPQREALSRPGNAGLVMAASRSAIQREMTKGAGVRRTAQSLTTTLGALGRVRLDADVPEPTSGDHFVVPQSAEWETTNIHQVAAALASAALRREETRGGHFRADFAHSDDQWLRRVVVRLNDAGELVTDLALLTREPHN